MDEDYHAAGAAGAKKVGKQHNTLPIWGNEASMNLNPLILANIQGSSYFKVHLFKLKTYHEVVDEIYYQVKHMEPWERGSRKTSGQTGMCGGVRGVGAGGIVSTAYCLLYKLYTLRLTRKQVNGLLNHTDSPYIRALGFMYLRYTQPPGDLYDWYEDYLQDEEEIDVKAGGGQIMTIGQMVYQFLTKLDWFSTLFPRIPVPMQKQIEKKIEQYCRENQVTISQLSSARVVGNSAIAAAAPYEEDINDRRKGGSGSGGNGAARGSRSAYNSRHDIPPPADNYRTEHDDRDAYYLGRSGRRDYSPSVERQERSNHSERHHHQDKHKKKHKHKHRSRSRSRCRSRSRSRTPPPHSRSGSRSRSSEHHRRKRDKHYERDYSHRKYS